MSKWSTKTSSSIDDNEVYTSGYIQVMDDCSEPEEVVIEEYFYDDKGMVIKKVVKKIKNKQNRYPIYPTYPIEPNIWYVNRGYSPYPEIT